MNSFTALRLIHIVVGAFWVGTLVFVAAFLMPAVRAAGAAGGAVMRQVMQGRHLHAFMIAASWLTILSGAVMAWWDSGTLGLRWFAQGSGLIFGIGAALALAATAVGMTVNAPTARRLAELSGALQNAGRPPSQQESERLGQLQARLARAAGTVAVLLLLTTAAMAVAQYAPY